MQSLKMNPLTYSFDKKKNSHQNTLENADYSGSRKNKQSIEFMQRRYSNPANKEEENYEEISNQKFNKHQQQQRPVTSKN